MKKFAAVIFDLDGTIIDSEEAWGKAYTSVLKKIGIENPDKHQHLRGESIKANWQNFMSIYQIKTEKTQEELEMLTYIEFQKLISEIELNDGALEFMDVLKEGGVPLAIATSSNWETADKVLKHFEIDNYFENITTAEEVFNLKPAPDIFLLTSEKLGIDPKDCLVIEDSQAGITAAHEAGMKVIAIIDGEDEDNLKDADLVVSGFSDITLKAIDAIGED